MMSEERTYESAVDRLDEIISRLDSGDAQLRETLDLCAEAKTLIEFCAAELSAVDEGLKELNLDELARSLAPAQGASGGIDPVPASSGPAADGPGSSGSMAVPAEPSAADPPPPVEERPPISDDEVPF